MPGFLDPNAVSIEAEYTRYLDSDILGKIVLKNFAINVLGLDSRDIRAPVSRHGDVGNYKDFCDAGIRIHGRTYSIETKCSRHILAKKTRVVSPSPRWNFGKLLYSARSRRQRTDYELLFAVGVDSPGFEDSEAYWKHLHSMRTRHLKDRSTFRFFRLAPRGTVSGALWLLHYSPRRNSRRSTRRHARGDRTSTRLRVF